MNKATLQVVHGCKEEEDSVNSIGFGTGKLYEDLIHCPTTTN